MSCAGPGCRAIERPKAAPAFGEQIAEQCSGRLPMDTLKSLHELQRRSYRFLAAVCAAHFVTHEPTERWLCVTLGEQQDSRRNALSSSNKMHPFKPSKQQIEFMKIYQKIIKFFSIIKLSMKVLSHRMCWWRSLKTKRHLPSLLGMPRVTSANLARSMENQRAHRSNADRQRKLSSKEREAFSVGRSAR